MKLLNYMNEIIITKIFWRTASYDVHEKYTALAKN